MHLGIKYAVIYFYSHALVGRDHIGNSREDSSRNFYSHALVGRDRGDVGCHRGQDDFYSHALVGRDNVLFPMPCGPVISTHTPSWGVTAQPEDDPDWDKISTHTPSWGVTPLTGRPRRMNIFLLTRPRGA